MSLRDAPVRATIAVSDIARAAQFYEDTLGLAARPGAPDPVRIYACGGDTTLQVYESPDHAGKATATLASWSVPDIDAVVDELRGKGVEFERYDGRFQADEKGIHSFGEHRVAWFKDPEGNTSAIDNGL